MKNVIILSVCVLVGACSNSSGDGQKKSSAADFKGTWKYSTGTFTATCAGQVTTQQLMGMFRLEEGTRSPLAMIDGPCTIGLSIFGRTASIEPTQTCTFVDSRQNATITDTYTVYNLELDSSGKTVSLSMSGSETIVANGQSLACTITLNGTATRETK